MGKKIKTYLLQVVICFFVFGLICWLFNVIFDNDSTINAELILQSAIFSLLFSAWTCYSDRNKSDRK